MVILKRMELRETKRLLDLCRYENDLHIEGYEKIAGVDESGRGSLAGPLVAAAVILDKRKVMIEDIADFISTDLGARYLRIVNGDRLIVSIAAASIVAKVIRDQIMLKLSRYYPEYGFEHNKGYGTRKHLMSLQKYGPTAIHRVSFRGVLS